MLSSNSCNAICVIIYKKCRFHFHNVVFTFNLYVFYKINIIPFNFYEKMYLCIFILYE